MQFISVNFSQNHFKFEIGYFSPITLPPKYIYIYIYSLRMGFGFANLKN